MLIEFGNTVVKPTWYVDEPQATGYSRIYDIQQGTVIYEAEGVQRQLEAGRIYVFPSTMAYRMRRSPGTVFSCTYMHINFFQARVTGLIVLDPREDDCLRRYMQTIRAAIRENRIELLENMSDSFPLFIRDQHAFVHSGPMQRTVQEYIMHHMAGEIRVEELSQLFSYHPNYFIRLFRQETGYTPHQFILQHRMQYAVSLLIRGMSNQGICEACGYTDSSTFTRAFRQYYGVTPQKYLMRFHHTAL